MQVDDLQFIAKTQDFSKDYDHLRNRLQAYNGSQIENYRVDDLLLLYKTPNEEIVAGLYGYQSMGRFCVDMLWVGDAYRNRGLGSELLKYAEKQSSNLNDLYVRVNTASFQALDFYRKNGYKVLSKLPLKTNHLEQQYDYCLVKYLTEIL